MADFSSILASIIPFNPSAGNSIPGSGSNNLKDLIDQISGAQRTPISAPPKVNPLQSIIEALAAGISTGTSNNPGQALASQLGGIQERRFVAEQQDRQRQNALEGLKLQTQLETAKDVMGEQRQIRAEQRAEAATVRRTKREQADDLIKFNREMAGKEKLFNLSAQENRSLSDIDRAFKSEMFDREKEYQRDMAEAESKDRKVAKTADSSLSLIAYGVPVETAYSIARKFLNDEKLDKGESQALDTAMKRQLAAQTARRRGGAGGDAYSGVSISEKQAWTLMQKFATDEYYKLSDGRVVSKDSLPIGITGQPEPIGSDAEGKPVKVVGTLDSQEKAQHVLTTVMPAIRSAIKPNTPKAQVVEGTKATLDSKQFDAIVDQLRAQKVPDVEILQQLKDAETTMPGMKEVVTGVIIRKGLGKGKASNNFKAGTPIGAIPNQSKRKLE